MKNTEGDFILSEAKPSAAASGCTSISDSKPIYVRIFFKSADLCRGHTAWPVFLHWRPPAHSTRGYCVYRAQFLYIVLETCYQAWWEVSHKWLWTICLKCLLWSQWSVKLWFVASVPSCNSSWLSLTTGEANVKEYKKPKCFSGCSQLLAENYTSLLSGRFSETKLNEFLNVKQRVNYPHNRLN